ncbi:TetR/AcrR family transcriptional regulator [Pseudonocardia eucalypti]|uniref:TetR/AcrR family transcriptional regulator n=1 Tax=Pseudonocardia eucalypti TaxID=648755 RepID=A0ABP9PKM8_9PSEU|nr:AcrR family transcriptional regulator [Pseudonocardia eucalypti]
MPREPRHLKVTQDQYFAAALGQLAAHGAEGLTISRLCQALGVTSGSFYHYFGGWAGFVEALLAHWEDEQTQRIVRLARAEAGVEQRLGVLRRQALALPHDAEAAIRAWSRSDERVEAAQRKVDAQRHATLRAIIVDLGVPARDADRLATTGVALLVGMQQLHRPVDTELLSTVFDEFERTIRTLSPAADGCPRAG